MDAQKILLVDDNSFLLNVLRMVYEGEGYDVKIAADGMEALDVLVEEKIDLIVSDVLMPNMDGYYLCFKIRTDEKLKHIPVIIYTATYTSASEEKVAAEMGADRFIRKPAAVEVMLETAKELLAAPLKFDRAVPPQRSTEMMHKYNGQLIKKLELRNIELEEAQDSLEEVVANLRKAQEIAHLGNWEMALKNSNVTWSEETCRIMGLMPDDAKPSVEYFLSLIHPEDVAVVQATIENAVSTGQDMSYSSRIIRRDGATRHIYVEGKFDVDEEGKPLVMYGIIHDVTDAKLAEEKLISNKAALHKLNMELEERVKQRTEELQDANNDLEAYSFTVSHDLRTPIRAIQIFGSLLQNRFNTSGDPTANEYLDNILKCTTEMNDLIKDLLEFSRLGRTALVKTSVDMEVMANAMAQSLLYLEENKKSEINIEHLEAVNADPSVIKNIWLNLLSNGLKYRKKDRACKINVSSKVEDNMVVYAVQDNGVGFDMSYYFKLFKPFSRLHSASEFAGTGAGLAICDRIVRKHGGKIWAESVLNSGSTFYFSLPIN